MNQAFFALALSLLVSACAHHDSYVLLPDRSGQAGTLNVKPATGGKPLQLDRAYQSAESTGSGKLEQRSSNEQEVQERYGAALAASPPALARYTLYFLEGTDELTPASKGELAVILIEIKARPVPDIVVVGHTDRVGSVPDNDRLAWRRADAFRKQLVRSGITDDVIQVAGRGERELLVETADETPEPRNRRVEILVR